MSKIRETLKALSPEERDQFKQYGTSIKEIKKKMVELLQKGRANLEETGGNVSTGLVMRDEE
jgi:hypothetical protein